MKAKLTTGATTSRGTHTRSATLAAVDPPLWPDLDTNVRRQLHAQGRVIGVDKVLQNNGIKNEPRVFLINSVYVVPKSESTSLLVPVSPLLMPLARSVAYEFSKYYLHQQLIPL